MNSNHEELPRRGQQIWKLHGLHGLHVLHGLWQKITSDINNPTIPTLEPVKKSQSWDKVVLRTMDHLVQHNSPAPKLYR